MASRESEALSQLGGGACCQTGELRLMFERWGDVTAEPSGVPPGTEPRRFRRIRKLGQETVGPPAVHDHRIALSWRAALQ